MGLRTRFTDGIYIVQTIRFVDEIINPRCRWDSYGCVTVAQTWHVIDGIYQKMEDLQARLVELSRMGPPSSTLLARYSWDQATEHLARPNFAQICKRDHLWHL